MTIYLGTGGYSDRDLCGLLYPRDADKGRYLDYYADHYAAVEINSSFYAPLGRRAFEGMLEKARGRLQFAVKLHQSFSHDRTATAEQAQAFLQAIEPLTAAGHLAALLLQFPPSFDRTQQHRLYLAELVSWFSGYPLAVEFRHPSWHIGQVLQQFVEHELIWCSVDYPAVAGLPPSAIHVTGNIGYARLHGKNTGWWQAKDAAESHDYRYTPAEMQAMASHIAAQTDQVEQFYVFFQNTVKGHAVFNIAMLRDALIALALDVR